MEKIKKEPSEISLNITNTTGSDIPMNFLSNLANTADISNQYTQYKWDITGLLLQAYNRVTITFRNAASTGPYTTVSATMLSSNLQGLLDALNLLNIACFFYSTSGGSTFIETYNDNTEFTTLTIDSTTGYPDYYLFYEGTNAGTGGSWQIENPAGISIVSGVFPVITSAIDITTLLTAAGVEITGTAGSEDVVLTVNRQNLSTGATTLVTSGTFPASTPISLPFTMVAGFAYYISFD